MGRKTVRTYSDEQLLAELLRVGSLLGRSMLSLSDFKDCGKISRRPFYERFGSWGEALECAGLGRTCYHTYSDDLLLNELRRVAGSLGESTVTPQEFETHSEVSPFSLMCRFGGWGKALERAGLRHVHSPEQSDEELLEELRRVEESTGKSTITSLDFKEHSEISPFTLMYRFGQFRRIAGARRFGTHPRAARLFGRGIAGGTAKGRGVLGKSSLSLGVFRKHSKVPGHTVVRQFGGWAMALERAGLANAAGPRSAGRGTPVGQGKSRVGRIAAGRNAKSRCAHGQPGACALGFARHSRIATDVD